MRSRRIILALLLAASVSAAGCIKEAARTLGELQALNIELKNKFGDNVHVLSEGFGVRLKITYINSPLNDKTSAERATRAHETALLVKANYARINFLREIWVEFVRQKTHFIFVNYSEGFEIYGFDNKGGRISQPKDRLSYPKPGASTGFRYLATTDESDIAADGLLLDGEPGADKGLALLPHFKVSGNVQYVKAKPPAKVSFDFASFSDKEEFAQVTPITFVADGIAVVKTEGTFVGATTQFCYLNVAYSDFRKITDARQLTIKLGAREYPLAPHQFAALQRMNSFLKE